MWKAISGGVFAVDPGIRYLAVNQGGEIVEMEQRLPSFNPPDTDRMEELLVNPAVLDLTKRRGDLDLEGVEYVLIRYGLQYQAIFHFMDGHVSIGIESDARPVDIVTAVRDHLGLK